jgi:hypothetical protein
MSSNLKIRFIHPDANGRGREPHEKCSHITPRNRPSPAPSKVDQLLWSGFDQLPLITLSISQTAGAQDND